MQKKANFKKAEMFVNYYLQKDYENEPRRRLCKNKPKQTQFSDEWASVDRIAGKG